MILRARTLGTIADDFNRINVWRRGHFHHDSRFGVHMIVPVEQHQRRARTWQFVKRDVTQGNHAFPQKVLSIFVEMDGEALVSLMPLIQTRPKSLHRHAVQTFQGDLVDQVIDEIHFALRCVCRMSISVY